MDTILEMLHHHMYITSELNMIRQFLSVYTLKLLNGGRDYPHVIF